MEERRFSVRGSAAEPYEVRFVRRTPVNLSAYCTCPAGALGQVCKHRLGIMAGKAKGVVSGNDADVVIVHGWVGGTDVELEIQGLSEAEFQLEEAKRAVTAAKKRVAAAMAD